MVSSSTTDKKNLQSNRVRRFRQLSELTQADLAAQVGVSRQTVISIEAGNYSPSVYLALKISVAVEATVEELFQDEN